MTNTEFDVIYRKYRSFSVKVARLMLKNRVAAEDISQEAFYSLYKMMERLDASEERKLCALIKTITINKAKDYLKKNVNRMEFAAFDGDERKEVVDKRHNVEAKMLHMEENKYLNLVLQRLRDENPMNYEILIEVKYLGIPPESVAKEFNITVNNVNNRIMRTRHWVEKEMSRIYGD